MTHRLSFTIIPCALLAAVASAPAGDTPLTSELVASGFSQPIAIGHVPGDNDRLFIAERAGRIRIISDGSILPTPFLDITALVNTGWLEWGLLGLTFDPDYANNGYLYVHYSRRPDADCVIARYTVSQDDPNVIDPDSGMTILIVDQPNTNHRGGWLGFGPDGYLYVPFGDGGGQGDPNGRAQNLNLLQGSILRIDVHTDDFPLEPDRNYGIPADNPFADGGGLPEIWCYGLRNPWRCSFDRATGDFWIADVGQNAREEINVQPSTSMGGENYGWRCTEGTTCTGLSGCICNGPTLTAPIYEYDRTVGVSITGGYVYRGCAIPDLQGTYFFAEYQLSKLFSLRYEKGVVSDVQDRTLELEGILVRNVASFGEDAQGELYMCDYNGGEVFKIVPDGVPAASCALPGDMNCDGTVSVGDINPFVLALTDSDGYRKMFPDCDALNGDCSNDGAITVGDINCFVALVTGG